MMQMAITPPMHVTMRSTRIDPGVSALDMSSLSRWFGWMDGIIFASSAGMRGGRPAVFSRSAWACVCTLYLVC